MTGPNDITWQSFIYKSLQYIHNIEAMLQCKHEISISAFHIVLLLIDKGRSCFSYKSKLNHSGPGLECLRALHLTLSPTIQAN